MDIRVQLHLIKMSQYYDLACKLSQQGRMEELVQVMEEIKKERESWETLKKEL